MVLQTIKKKQLDKHRPLDVALVKNLEEWFRIELTYTSNAIEGNTLSRAETALIVEKGLTIGGKSITEHLEATNHAVALDFVKEQGKRNPSDLKEKDLLKIAEAIGITEQNLSILKTGKAKALRLTTLDAICQYLSCQPGDILEYKEDEKSQG